MRPELKTVIYEGFEGEGFADGEVEYMIVDNECIFSGSVIGATSTINTAEKVILAIAKAEGLEKAKQFTFYDLQTHLGYISKNPGQFNYLRVNFTWNGTFPDEINWERVKCPGRIRGLFWSHIGGSRTSQVGIDREDEDEEIVSAD